jgi:CDP-4-dehydro-6-deoxyglucose reductase
MDGSRYPSFMTQLLTVSRAAHLIGVSRTSLQQRIRDGELPSFDGLVSTEDLLRVWPDVSLEDTGAFEKIVAIRDDAFAKRLRERVLPSQEVLAQRLFVQGQELAELRRHLTRYHSLIDSVRGQLDREPLLTPADIGRLIDDGLAEVLASPAPANRLAAMDAMLRVMSAHVTVKPSGNEFFVDGSETLLKASLRAGLSPNYGCGNGNCGLCKARVVDGEVQQIANSDYAFSAVEKAQGFVLMCSCTAVSSELTLELLEAGAPDDIPEQRVLTKVRSVQRFNEEVIRLHLQTPRTNRLRFLAGQRATLGTSSGGDTHGEYSIASCPCDDRNLLFHISRSDFIDQRRSASADFSQRVFEGSLKAGDDVSVWGPWGDFVLEKESTRPLVFAAIDTGFAPINSLIEHAIAIDVVESMSLLWATETANGHYLANQGRAWAGALDSFEFVPLQSDDAGAALATALLARPNLAGADVYLAGPADAVLKIAIKLGAAGLPEAQLHVAAL